MGSMMKMAIPAAAVAAPFMFPGLGAAMGLTSAAGGAAAGTGAGGALGVSGLLNKLANPAVLGAMTQMLPQQQQMPQQAVPMTASPPMQMPQQPGMGGGLADAMFGGQITGSYRMPMTPDMLEPPRGGLLGRAMISRIG